MRNFLLITLDSLRYDVAMKADTPAFDTLMEKYQCSSDTWHKTYAHATYTLPAHTSIFSGGKLPCNASGIFPFDRTKGLFSFPTSKDRGKFALLKHHECILCYFKDRGYRSIGVGAVPWFSSLLGTSKDLWNRYFDEFYYEEEFSSKKADGLEAQIHLLSQLMNEKQPTFCFLNIGATHAPYRNEQASIDSQSKALTYVDTHINSIVDMFGSCDVYICADHGECFGEDGKWGHSFYHPKVMEVPSCFLEIP